MTVNFEFSTPIRDLPYKVTLKLAGELDVTGPGDWRALLAELPHGYYTRPQISALERAGFSPGGSSAEQLLSGLAQRNLCVGELISYLEAIDNQAALLLIKSHEPVTITQPLSNAIAQEGGTVSLECHATGFPKPFYQWLFNGTTMPGQCRKEMKLENVKTSQTGYYSCRATNPMGHQTTNAALVKITPQIANIGDNGESLPPVPGRAPPLEDPNNRMHPSITQNRDAFLLPGQNFCLASNCVANSYQWYKNGYRMVGATQQNLVFNSFQECDEGYYQCCIALEDGREQVTNTANLKLKGTPTTDQIQRTTDRINNISIDQGSIFNPNKEFATAKLALVIANQNYLHPRGDGEQLVHPIDDACLLTDALSDIGFKVMCLVDLTHKEMLQAVEGFCRLLECANGVYSLFYFCGHGFDANGKTHLVPIDAEVHWSTDMSVSAESVLSRIQHCKTTKVDVMLLDVCRILTKSAATTPVNGAPVFEPPLIAGSEYIIGYATCPQSQAFEKRRDKNGIYMKHLEKHIRENIGIPQLLQKVNAAVREETKQNYRTNGMAPGYAAFLNRPFSLCDRILPGTGFVEGERDPSVEWFTYHRLPEAGCVEFSLGVVVEVKFEYVCTNMANCVIHVQNVGLTQHCEAFIKTITDESGSEILRSEISEAPTEEFLSKAMRFDSFNSEFSSVNEEEIEKIMKLPHLQRLNGNCSIEIAINYDNEGQRHTQQKTYTFSNLDFGITAYFKT